MTTLAAPAPACSPGRSRSPARPRFANLTAFYLPLSVVPARAVAAGAPDGAAGLVTAALMLGGVLAECVAPRLMARFGDRVVLAAGLLLLGGGALLLVPAVDVVLGGAGLRAARPRVRVRGRRHRRAGRPARARRAPRRGPRGRRGRGLRARRRRAARRGVAGRRLWGADAVFVVAAAVALAGVVRAARARRDGRGGGAARATAAAVEQPAGLVAVARTPVQRRPALLFAATTVAGGIVVAYLPLAAAGPAVALGLFVQALAATAGRYGAGRWGDRHGHARLVGPGLAACGLGMVLLLGVDRPAVLLAAMAVFGTGFGVVQSATYAVMVERAPAGRRRRGERAVEPRLRPRVRHGSAGVRRRRRGERLSRGVRPHGAGRAGGAARGPADRLRSAGVRRRAATARVPPGDGVVLGGRGRSEQVASRCCMPSAAAISATGTSTASQTSDTRATPDPSRRHPALIHRCERSRGLRPVHQVQRRGRDPPARSPPPVRGQRGLRGEEPQTPCTPPPGWAAALPR